MKNKKIHKWMLTFGGTGAFIGLIIGNLLSGNFDSAVVLGGFTALLTMFIIDLVRMRLKKDKTPDFDERTVNNIRKFYAYSGNVFIALCFVSLGIISFMDIEHIAISYLFIPFLGYLFFSGIGAFIVSRK